MRFLFGLTGFTILFLMFYMLFKIGFYAYKIKAKVEKRKYLGFYNEFDRNAFNNFPDVFPIPLSYESSDSEIVFWSKRRMLFVKLFWGMFIIGTLLAFVSEAYS